MPNPVVAVDTAIKSVLVTTDFSKASEKPLRHALALPITTTPTFTWHI
jgi:hypothetical protein